MKFLDLAGVKQFKDYTDETFVSTEDYSVIEDVDRDTYTKQEIDTMISDIESGGSDLTNYYTKSQADSKFVEAVSGKQLSTNDYTTAEKNKLSEIESGAQANVQADWSVTNSSSAAYIKNKPTIPSIAGLATEQYVDEEILANATTESTVSGWGFTKNAGTITGITMNGASKGTSGVIDLGTVVTDISGKADKSAAIGSLSLSLNSTDYKITLSGTKVDGTTFTVSDVIDLPLESVVVNGSYDDTTKKVVLTLKNGNTVDFSIADLIAGLQSEITSTNKLSADLIADGTTNKVVTATEKSTWNGKQDAISDLATIRSNAEAGAAKVSNVQSDWNATSGLAQILNKPTIPTVGEGELTIKVNGTTIETFGANQGDDDEIDISIPTESTVSGWGFTKNAGTLTGVSFNGTNATVTNGIAAITATIPAAANNATITIQKGGTTVDSFTVNASSNKSINIPNELPSYSASDSGKILSVNSSGQLVWITPSYIYSGSATPDSNTGNNGDIYLQV